MIKTIIYQNKEIMIGFSTNPFNSIYGVHKPCYFDTKKEYSSLMSIFGKCSRCGYEFSDRTKNIYKFLLTVNGDKEKGYKGAFYIYNIKF